MVAAIGSAATTSVTKPSDSRIGLEAQIARDRKELSACVNCASAKTAEGKAQIQALSIKISKAEARLQAIASGQPTPTPAVETPRVANTAKRVDDFA